MLVAAAGTPRSNGILCYLFALVCISLNYIYIETVRYLQEIAPPPKEFAKIFDSELLAVLDNYGHDDSSPDRTNNNNGSSFSVSQKNINNANKNLTFTFPGIQERVQYYMGDWYHYNHSTVGFLDANRVCREVPFYRPSNGVRWHDVPYLFGADTLRTDPPPPGLTRRQEHYFRDAWRNVFAGYSYRDHGELSLPARDHDVVTANIENGSTNNHDDDIRVAMMLGDWVDTEPIPFPVMMKSRLAKSSYSAANAASAASMLEPSAKTPAEETRTRRMAPILCLLNVARHFNRTVDDLNKVKQTPWKRKKDMLVWRGSSTGHGRRTAALQRIIRSSSAGNNNNGTGGDYSNMMDVGFFMLNQGEQDKPDLVRLLKPRMTMREQLRYKYLLSLEGNDVSSGLKWMLYSNSVVFMTKPTRVSWAMEDKLVPWYHYVPILDEEDYSDLPRRIAWAREHDAECRRISQQATEYVERLYASPEAKRTNRIIQGMIAQRYRALYGPALAQCAKDRDPYRGWCPNNSNSSSSIKSNGTGTNNRTSENQTTRPTTTAMTNNTAPVSLYTGPWAWLKPCENDPVNMRSLSNNSDLLWTSKKKQTGIRGKQQQQARRRARSSSRRKKNQSNNNNNKEKQQKENRQVQQQQLHGAPKMKMMRNKKNWKSVNQK